MTFSILSVTSCSTRSGLAPGKKVVWQRPAVLDDGQEFVVADSEGNLHRVGLDASEPPQLKVRASGWAAGSIYSPVACLGKSLFAAVDTS